ncbi:MAG: hypothetical protein ACOYNN_07240 [Terrimicrobiaceae bacterium]
MRTTVTIDPDTEALLREEIRRTGLSFKEVLNRSVRRAIVSHSPVRSRVAVKPIFNAPFPVDFENRSFNAVADELNDEATLRGIGA